MPHAKLTALVFLGLFTTVGLACTKSTETPSADAVEMEASSQTRSELGVERWGMRLGEGRFTVVRGYDATNTAIVEFDYTTARGAKHTFEARLRHKDDVARMELATAGTSAPLDVLENTFPANPQARRVLDRIVADLGSQKPRATKPLAFHERLRLQGLTDSDGGGLVEGPTNLLPGCAGAIVDSANAGASTASKCADSNGGDCNSAGVGRAVQAQDTSGTQCNEASKADRFPVAGPHNLGYDANWATWSCDGSNSNSDFHTGAGDANHQNGHLGNDIFAAVGTKLVAMTDATVVETTTENPSHDPSASPIGGNSITLKDKDGWSYYYAHMDSPTTLAKGQTVMAGQEIGALGKSGQARGTEAHLHFSIYPNDDYDQGIDPYERLAKVEKDACQ
ncbi:M23 family metallopeptidase [Pendulispora brunnea]|uniref:M23 family metallopeptidase n=1 Tax=Pendulispora brunnea TaxID=2905690 RepID=A0ABZ2K5X9_9BACT